MTRRGAGEGSIFKDPANGRWRALVDVGADASGKRQRKKVSGRTRAEVLLNPDPPLRLIVSGVP